MVKEYGPVTSFAFGGLSGAFACTLSNPFEVVKTRYQLQAELGKGSKQYNSLSHAFLKIMREEGIWGIQRGLLASISFQTLFNGVRIGLFDHVKLYTHSDAAPFISKVLAGAATGCLAASACSPLYMIKCRLQSQASGNALSVSTDHGYKGVTDGLYKVFKEQGPAGLYRGVDGFVLRTVVGSAFQLSVFDMAKGPCQEHVGSWPGTLVAAGCAGIAASTAMNPFDVVATRLYNQPRSPTGAGIVYSGPIDCLRKSVHIEGAAVIYRGWLAHTARLAPHTIYCLVFFEKVKEYAEASGF